MSASRETHACRSARGRLITASERKRNFKSAARRRAAAPPCTGLTLRAGRARGGAGGARGTPRGAGRRGRRDGWGESAWRIFTFAGAGESERGRRAVRRALAPCGVRAARCRVLAPRCSHYGLGRAARHDDTSFVTFSVFHKSYSDIKTKLKRSIAQLSLNKTLYLHVL